MPLSSVGCWHRLFYNSPCTSSAHCWSPGAELRSSSLVWVFFVCLFSVPPPFFTSWFQGHLRKLPLEYKVVAGYPTCSSLSFSHWLVPWTFFLMTASWLTASSCTCSRASGCFCLELKKVQTTSCQWHFNWESLLGSCDKFKLNALPQRSEEKVKVFTRIQMLNK